MPFGVAAPEPFRGHTRIATLQTVTGAGRRWRCVLTGAQGPWPTWGRTPRQPHLPQHLSDRCELRTGFLLNVYFHYFSSLLPKGFIAKFKEALASSEVNTLLYIYPTMKEGSLGAGARRLLPAVLPDGVSVSPEFFCRNPHPQGDGTRRWGLWRGLGQRWSLEWN